MALVDGILALASRVAAEFNTVRSEMSGGGGVAGMWQRSKTDGEALTSASGTNPPLPTDTVDWDASDLTLTGISYASGEVTIGPEIDGKQASMNVQILGDGFNNRTQVVVHIERDAGGGWVTLKRSSNYNSRDSDQNEGATSISGYGVLLTDGHKYRIQVGNNHDGNVGIYSPDGCYWSILVL